MKHFLVNRTKLANPYSDRHNIIYARPTPWKEFLCAVFGLCRHLGFILLNEEHLEQFYAESRPVACTNNQLRINGAQYDVEPITFWGVFIFCTESLQFGYFLKFWRWRWKG